MAPARWGGPSAVRCLYFSSSSRLRAPSEASRREPNDGKTVIITGSSRGIGRSIALRLAADGYDVCINDVAANAKGGESVVKEVESLGRKACFAVADVSKRDEVVGMIQTSVKELGPLSVM
jgi:NAD(P)-dependent dehydrogenase (short-subunit alcohol dehydrogenase family)